MGSKSAQNKGSYRILVNEMKMMLTNLEPSVSSDCCIYRVPEKLRKVNEEAYIPSEVSIGPFHHGREELKTMEKHKPRCLDKFIRLTNTSLDDLVCNVKQSETSIRRCYAETFPHISSDEFVKMILLDAAFIIVLFYRNNHSLEDDEDKRMLENCSLRSSIELDLVLLENQLPFFVLKNLYELVYSHRPAQENPSFLELSRKYFAKYNRQKKIKKHVDDIKHFTDLVRLFHLPPFPLPLQETVAIAKITNLHCASELHWAGVRFQEKNSNCLRHVSFNQAGVLRIPQIEFEDATQSVFRNLMALEQCHYPKETHICCYFVLTEDADLLVQNKIIDNGLTFFCIVC